ncbi:MAG: hypothetical protein AAF666_05340 [Pseudomonadota bacterium]
MTEPDEGLPPLSADTLPLYLPLYMDGALDQADRSAVEDLMKDNPEAEEILRLLDHADHALPDAFGDVLDAPLPLALARAASAAGAALEDRPAPPAQRSHFWGVAAAAVFALMIGVPGGFFYGQQQGRDAALIESADQTRARFGWVAQIVGYHRLYSAEERHLVEVSAAEADHIQTWIGNRTGRSFSIPDLSGQGLEFRVARLLAVNGKPTAQLMYVPTDGGDPIGLCFLRTGAEAAGLTDRARDEFNMTTWRRDGYSFIAIGTQPPEVIRQVAESASVAL